MEIQVVCRASGRPKKDGNPQVELRTIEVPEPAALSDLGFKTYRDYLESQEDWKGKAISVIDDLELPKHELPLGEFPDDAKIEVIGLVRPPTLSDSQFDPFKKFKADPGFYYRALNTDKKNLQKRRYEGYELVGSEATYGDLVLGKLPKEMKEARDKAKLRKTQDQQKAAKESFHETAERLGIKSFEG